MRAISMSRTIAVFLASALAGGCTDDPTGIDGGVGSPVQTTITLTPLSATVRPGQSILLDARLLDGAGHAMQGVKFSWRSSDNAVAIVSAAGEVVGQRPGRALITASARGKSQAATIDVQFHGPKAPLEQDPDQEPKGGAR
jgi:hypothetical protein